MMDVFLLKLNSMGPAAALFYVERMQALEREALQDTQQLFSNVIALNRQIAGEAGRRGGGARCP